MPSQRGLAQHVIQRDNSRTRRQGTLIHLLYHSLPCFSPHLGNLQDQALGFYIPHEAQNFDLDYPVGTSAVLNPTDS